MFAFCLWVNAHNDANAAESEMVSRKVALCTVGVSVTSVRNHIDCGLREVGGILFTARDSPRAQTPPARHNSALMCSLISSSYPSSSKL